MLWLVLTYQSLYKQSIYDNWKNKFDTPQDTSERHTPNNEHENFVTTHIEAATAEYIPFKQRAKSKVLWESIVFGKNEKTWKNILTKLKKLNKWTKEQLEYIQDQSEIR